MKINNREFELRKWHPGLEPVIGDHIAIDTETELIKEHYIVPPLVLLQATNGKMIDLVPWEYADEYITMLHQVNPKSIYYFFNVGFDFFVLNQHKVLLTALDEDRCVDIQLRLMLKDLAEKGDIKRRSLKSWAQLIGVDLIKDDELRLNFERGKPITDKQYVYAAKDAAVTYMLAEATPVQATEKLQTKAAVALRAIELNGLYINKEEYVRVKNKYLAELQNCIFELKQFGLYLSIDDDDMETILDDIKTLSGIPSSYEIDVNLTTAKWFMVSAICAYLNDATNWKELFKTLVQNKPKAELIKTKFNEIFSNFDIGDMICKENAPTNIYKALRVFLQNITIKKDLKEAFKELINYWASLIELRDPKIEKPQKVLQRELERIEKQFKIHLKRTPSGLISSNKESLTSIKEMGVQDPFLDTYLQTKKIQLYLGLFFKDWLIGPDSRMHPKYEVLKRTGRMSCSSPNLQQLPKKGDVRRIYQAPPGYVLIDVDYNQLELCALAQDCYSRFGFSKLRELINAGLDLHSWFAARVLGYITNENDYDGTEESLKRVKELYSKVPPELRDVAKACNFGFPGGMGAARFLASQKISGNYKITLEECENLKSKWFEAFPEVKEHLKCQQYSIDSEGNALYMVETLTGRVRVNCTLNQAANTKFQGLAADGSKLAIWRLFTKGYKIVNVVHDEIIVEVKETEDLLPVVKDIENIMITEMQRVIPDVVIKVDTAVTRVWDKKAESKIINGKITIWEPEKE